MNRRFFSLFFSLSQRTLLSSAVSVSQANAHTALLRLLLQRRAVSVLSLWEHTHAHTERSSSCPHKDKSGCKQQRRCRRQNKKQKSKWQSHSETRPTTTATTTSTPRSRLSRRGWAYPRRLRSRDTSGSAEREARTRKKKRRRRPSKFFSLLSILQGTCRWPLFDYCGLQTSANSTHVCAAGLEQGPSCLFELEEEKSTGKREKSGTFFSFRSSKRRGERNWR